MKRLFALVCVAAFAAACTTPTTNQPSANRTVTKETKPAPAISEADATAKEKEAWDAIGKKNYDAFADLLATDYLEINDQSVSDRTTSIGLVKDLTVSDVSYSDWKLLPIDKDSFAITYTVNLKGTYKGQAFPMTAVRASSAWVKRDGKWVAVYHQETDVKKAPPAPKGSPTAQPASSPASSPAQTGPDPEANEKLVWDALKRKDTDAFAALIAPDSIEVEADAVYDKTASVKSVSMFDFSKAELSEWKTVKLDNDAALVTYLLKLPGANPDEERHSTIWANRGGKWMALFHQGTPAAMPAKKPAK